MNECIFYGRLTDDPELRGSEENPVCKFDIAVNEHIGDGNEKTTFVPITAFNHRNLATVCHRFLNKGREVLVRARLEISSYTDKDGNKRRSYDFVAQDVQFIGQVNRSNPDEAPSSVKKGMEKGRKMFDRRRSR